MRRGSRASLNQTIDREALHEALDNIHSAASQSSNLTVFNEFADPPTIQSGGEVKGFAGELQDGLSGLYSKLKASVGVNKENGEKRTGVAEGRDVQYFNDDESLENQTGSGRLSRATSPPLLPIETRLAQDIGDHNLKSASRSSTSVTPALKSPEILSQKNNHFLADPAVIEINVHAARASVQQSKQNSLNENKPANIGVEHYVPPQNTPNGLQREAVKARNPAEVMSPLPEVYSTSPLINPGVRESEPDVTTPFDPARVDQAPEESSESENEVSERLARAKRSDDQARSPATRSSAELERSSEVPDQSIVPAPKARKLLSPQRQTSPASTPVSSVPQVGSTALSPSRLPGYQVSRASSTDSTLARSSVTAAPSKVNQKLDGTQDERPKAALQGTRSTHGRRRLLDREFWMRDENAKDCFRCGEPFSTFRRKHHCRICGQIFDSKCTTLIDGTQFGSISAVRVCKPCQAILAAQEDDSSDFSGDDVEVAEPQNRPRTPIAERQLKSAHLDDDAASIISQSLEQMSRTPTMSVPLRRAVDSSHRNSAVLEFDATDHVLPRPNSSRSLRASHSVTYGHRRLNSRHQHMRNLKAYHEDRAPFQRRLTEDAKHPHKQSAFHYDSVIDPDLAQYLSDDASSGDESVQLETGEDKLSRSIPETDRSTVSGLLAAVRKGRSRIGERSIIGMINLSRDGDNESVTGLRTGFQSWPSRKRNASISSSIQQRTTPRSTRENLSLAIPNSGDRMRPVSPSPAILNRRSRMIRSASMIGLGAPAVELNRASLQHVHKLLQQLLADAEVPHATSWEKALIPILLRATDDVDPDVPGGDDMDIRNYVKLKKIPGGKPSDSSYISGLVFTKNLALKSMSRFISNPRVLVISFSLEYARYEQHFMSLDPVIRQEKEYLANLVGRIVALKPNVVFSQKNISGFALGLLDKANIATAYNVKSTVIEAVSRCTQTRVMHSIDKLAAQPSQLGTCESFEVKTFASEGRKKTYIYLSGCIPHLGCTIALRGAETRLLSKVKRITEFMVYVVYNLKLETCLMRDEWALIPSADATDSPEAPQNGTIIKPDQAASMTSQQVVPSPENDAEEERISTSALSRGLDKEIHEIKASEPIAALETEDGPEIPDDVPVPSFYEDLVEKHQTKILSASPYVKFTPPYLLMRARNLERRVAYLKRLRDEDILEEHNPEEKTKPQKFVLIQPDMVHAKLVGASKRVKDIVHAVHDAEYDKALHNYETQKRMWEAHLSGNKNLFDPYAHQNIVVLFSLVATETSVPCSGPDMLAFVYYNEHESEGEFEADCTLGQYVEDLCYRANDPCSSNACEKALHEHHRQYVHGGAQINVFVHPQPAKMRGMQNTILMWSQCRICGVETTVAPMSQSTWKYSFGKYLELSFWSADLRARASTCAHDLHRDHLRFFGYKDFALRFNFDQISLLEIIVPRMRITWKVDNDLKFRNDIYGRIEHRLTKFMTSVKYRLKSIKIDAVLPELVEECRAEVENLNKKANEDHTQLIRFLQERYTNSKHWETNPLNRAVRTTLEKVAEWENLFNDFEQKFFPSEKDIRRLATLQLQKIFLDRDVSVTSLAQSEEESSTPPTEEVVDEKHPAADQKSSNPRRATVLSPEKAHSVLKSVVEEHSNLSNEENPLDSPPTELAVIPRVEISSDVSKTAENLQHLDLAVSSTARLSPETASPGRLELVAQNNPEDESLLGTKVPSPPAEGEASNTAPISQTSLSPSPSVLKRQATDVPHGRDQEMNSRRPSFQRAHSQPAQPSPPAPIHIEGSPGAAREITDAADVDQTSKSSLSQTSGYAIPIKSDKKLSERLGLTHLKPGRLVRGHSLIPRAVSSKKDSRVSSLAKHFEQLSREFEKERIRERRQRAARHRQSRVYPVAASKPIVEVYRNVDEAVQEKDTSDVLFVDDKHENELDQADISTTDGMANVTSSLNNSDDLHTEPVVAETSETDADNQETSRAPSEAGDTENSDIELELDDIPLPDAPEDLLRLSQEDLEFKELQKHERSSLMKMLNTFWAERSSSGWTPLEFPIRPFDHIFTDCDIIVREDEPSSIIAFALNSKDYRTTLREIQEIPTDATDQLEDHHHLLSDDTQSDLLHSLLRKTGTHLKYQFQEGSAKMLCKIFFAEQFDAVRRKCGVSDRIVESLSRCLKWDSKGGKTKSLFLKTLDDRFVLKSLSPIETQSFLKFAPNYFQIMSEAFFHELPSVIAKMLGFYQIVIKNPVTGVEYNWFLLVMENLFYDRTPTRIFDLKGSMRNRKIQSTGEKNEVLLDENMVEFIYESPLFTRDHSKKLLKSSVHNDTLFLARQNVMDYSLMVAIDENRKELVVGIIDCIRTYTWDKKLETWIKDRGFAGGNKNRPTVTSPKEYKKRFREAMGRYILEAPNCWHQFRPMTVERRILPGDPAGNEKDDGAEETAEVLRS